MLAASLRREVHFGNVLASRMQSRVPRCLFGSPNPKETAEMLQDALDMERTKFARRWGVDPSSEDKENFQRKYERVDGRSPRKNRTTPYSRQTSIHEYWRVRKVCEPSKKGLTISSENTKKQSQDGQKLLGSPK
ncbi:uncharacterized protein [Venturia canescens]|uniref:uncharacterized protein n=1 Tax=Venturia canescens TaxID=32260 RepID=UPI001C9C7928|nr:uncharacterized protein LOC122415904 [Venturia canescens]